MGYFSELDLRNKETNIDSSYHGFEEQLLWRYENLKERYSRLSREGAPMYGDDCFNKNDYRYAPVECFNTLSDVYRAMEIAKEDLEAKCDMIIDDGNVIDCSQEEEDPNQISLLEVVLLPLCLRTSIAA